MPGTSIIQCFDVTLNSLIPQLDSIKARGFTDIQISPIQSHCRHIWKWYRLYQPTGTSIGNSIGSIDDLKELIERCNHLSIGVIVDVVLHHTTGCPLCNFPGAYRWFSTMFKGMFFKQNLNISSRFNCTDFGPRVDTNSEHVFESQLNLLQQLVDLGVAGFRFDAAKHISPQYLRNLLNGLKSDRFLLCYSECMDGNPTICSEYIWEGNPPMMAIDFTTVFRMIEAFGFGGDLCRLQEHSIPSHRSIVMADCHDSKIGDSYQFKEEKDGILAMCFLLARAAGIPLVWGPFSEDPQIAAGLKFYQTHHGTDFRYHRDCNSNLLIILRGDSGFAVLNKSNEWIRHDQLCLTGMRDGSYQELAFDFNIHTEKGEDGNVWVKNWGNKGEGGFEIGPRQVLYLTHV